MSKKLKFELNENNIKLFIKLKQETKQNEDQIIRSYIDYLNKNINTISNMNFDSDKETLKFINKFKIDNMKYFKYDLDKCVEELQKNNILLNKKQVLKIFNFIDNI
jgi:hypothetical protein